MKSNLTKFFVVLVVFIFVILLLLLISYFGGKGSVRTEEETHLCECDELFGNPTRTGLLWEHIRSVLFDTKLFTVFLAATISVFGSTFFGGNKNVGDQDFGWKERVKSGLKSGGVFLLLYVIVIIGAIVLWFLGLIPLFSYSPQPEAVVCRAILQGQEFEYNFFEGFSFIERGDDNIDPELRERLTEKCENRDRDCYFFLTGQRGVGKSTFLKKFLEKLQGGYLYLNFKLINVADTNKYLRTSVGLDVDFPEEDVWNVIEKVLTKCPKTVVVIEDLVRAEDDFVDDRLRIAYGMYRLHEKGLPIIFSSSNPNLLGRLQKTGRLYNLEDFYELDVIHDEALLGCEHYKRLEERIQLSFSKSLDIAGGFFKDLERAFKRSKERAEYSKEVNLYLLEKQIEQDLKKLEMEFCEKYVIEMIEEAGLSKERDIDLLNFGYLLWSDLRRESVIQSGECKYPYSVQILDVELVLLEYYKGKYADLNLINRGLREDRCFYFSTRLVGIVLNGDICKSYYCRKYSESEFCEGGEY